MRPMPTKPAATRPRSARTPRTKAAWAPTKHHSTGTIKGLRGVGSTAKQRTPTGGVGATKDAAKLFDREGRLHSRSG